MKSTFRKTIALALSVMFLFFTVPGLPASALGDQDGSKPAFDNSLPPDSGIPDLSGVPDKKAGLTKSQKKLSSQLLQLSDPSFLPQGKTKDSLVGELAGQKMITYGKSKDAGSALAKVYIKLNPGSNPEELGSLAQITNQDLDNNLVVANVAVDDLDALAGIDAVAGVDMVMPPVVYKVNSTEGDAVHRSDIARTLGGVDGTGVKIGVISDGVDYIDDVIATGDLPAKGAGSMTVLSNAVGGDEGTAMLEIIHDMAPGAELFFHDCGDEWVAFNQAIDDLVAAGCTIVVDDIGWLTQPFFEDGIIASHIKDYVDNNEIVYVSSAGNAATEHYQGTFYNAGSGYHDFSRGKDASYKQIYMTLDPGEYTIVVLEWNDYFGNSSNDYDLMLINRANMQVVAMSYEVQDGAGCDPVEAFIYENDTASTLNLAVYVELYDGTAKNLELYMYPGYGVTLSSKNLVTSNSIFGHAAVPGVITCGAIRYSTPTQIEYFSSQGPVTMIDGTYRQKPDVCGADGVSVSGSPEFPSTFYGTSAAAPHVAAIAALVWSKNPAFEPDQVRARIVDNAIDLGTAGFDSVFGYGRADAYYSVLDFYNVSFEENGGTTVANQRVATGDKVTEPTITRTGATLLGWYLEPEFTTLWDFDTDTVTNDITLHAKWEVAKFDVTFDSHGGSVVDALADVEYGNKIAAPTAPTRAGYTFAGWCTDAACTVMWNFAANTVTSDITLHAKWYAAAPTNPRAKSLSYNSVRVAWDASAAAPDITGYEVWRATSASGTYTKVGTVNAATLTLLNSGLTTNTTYYYKVRAYYESGSRVIAGYFSAVTAVVRPIPAAPATCVADPAGYNSIKVVWGAVSGASGYEVYRATSSAGAYTKVATVTATSYTNTGLNTGAPYYYKVRAYRTVGSTKVYGAFSVSDGARPVLGIPTTVRAARASATSIKVTWGGVTGASGYELWRSTSSTGTYVLVKATTAKYFTNVGLTTGKWYYYKVRAYRMVGSTKVYSSFSSYSAAKP